MKNLIILAVVLVLAVGGYFIWDRMSKKDEVPKDGTLTETLQTPNDGNVGSNTEETPNIEDPKSPTEVQEGEETIGKSVEGRDIVAHHYGTGEKEVMFVGGIHGGYEWNTALLAYELVDYLDANPKAIPEDVRVTVIPVLNPDGLFKIVGTTGKFAVAKVPALESATIPGRFNANTVDLNRNFDCEWAPSGTWQTRAVSGGSEAFSEPEAKAMRDYVDAHDPAGVVVYYSAAGGVFASNCKDGILPETKEIMNAYATASGYKAYDNFNFYEITGDMVNWLAKEKIPAISILLTTHKDVEWDKNRAGIDAILNYYSK